MTSEGPSLGSRVRRNRCPAVTDGVAIRTTDSRTVENNRTSVASRGHSRRTGAAQNMGSPFRQHCGTALRMRNGTSVAPHDATCDHPLSVADNISSIKTMAYYSSTKLACAQACTAFPARACRGIFRLLVPSINQRELFDPDWLRKITCGGALNSHLAAGFSG